MAYLIIGSLNALPCVTLILINSALVIFAMKRSNSQINKTNILVVILVTVFFFVSSLPLYVQLTLLLSPLYMEISWSLTYLSSWINPFIYCAVNPSFNTFTRMKLFCRKRRITPGQSSILTQIRNSDLTEIQT